MNIRQHLKNSIEYKIPISDIVKPILPQITMEIIKVKKQHNKDSIKKLNKIEQES